jgi:hypothetical protein
VASGWCPAVFFQISGPLHGRMIVRHALACLTFALGHSYAVSLKVPSSPLPVWW